MGRGSWYRVFPGAGTTGGAGAARYGDYVTRVRHWGRWLEILSKELTWGLGGVIINDMETTSNTTTATETKWTKEARGWYTAVVETREGDPNVEITIEQNWDGMYSFATRTEWIMFTETGYNREYDWEPFATLRSAKVAAGHVIDHIHYTEQQRFLAHCG